jgi:hypothetical protein
MRVRVQTGHTVGRDHLSEKRPKIIADPAPCLMSATSEKYRKHHTPILLLVSLPVGRRVDLQSL